MPIKLVRIWDERDIRFKADHMFYQSILAEMKLNSNNYIRVARLVPSVIENRDHPFKTSANFHDFWPLPPYHRNSSKMLMKGIFGPYVLWPLDKNLIFWIVTRVSARDYTVYLLQFESIGVVWMSKTKTKCKSYFGLVQKVWNQHNM